MNTNARAAWILTAIFGVIAVAAAVARPVHWERTVAVAVVLGVAGGVFALRQRRARAS